MPCRDYGPSEEDQQNKIDNLTKMLCGICRRTEEMGDRIQKSPVPLQVTELDLAFLIENDPKLIEWWKEHKKLDARRRRYEKEQLEKKRLRKSALKKLTPEERKALGV